MIIETKQTDRKIAGVPYRGAPLLNCKNIVPLVAEPRPPPPRLAQQTITPLDYI